MQELHHPLVGAGQDGSECDPEVVERGCQWLHVETPHRDDTFVRDVDERVGLGGIQFEHQLAVGELERVAQCPMYLRKAAIRQRILQIARHLGLPQPAAGE